MPALEFWEFAEGWHAAFGVTVGDFPEESAVRLGLDLFHGEVGGFLQAAAGGAVAFGTVSLEELCAACCGVPVFGKRIFASCGLVWRAPGWILFVVGVLGCCVGGENHEQQQIPQG